MSIIAGGRERNLISSVGFTVGTEVSNVINVAVQLRGTNNDDLAERACVYAYLSDDAEGDGITASVPDSVAIGTNGVIIEALTAAASFRILANATGDFDIDITEATGTPTFHLVVVLPNGDLAVSDAITFA